MYNKEAFIRLITKLDSYGNIHDYKQNTCMCVYVYYNMYNFLTFFVTFLYLQLFN